MRRLLILPLLAGCTAFGPDYDPPVPNAYDAFVEAEGYDAAPASARWWTAFGDPELDRLVGLALARNNDVGAALANVNAARAQVGLARLDRLPFDTLSASYTESRQSAGVIGANFPGGADIDGPLPNNDVLNLGIAASWEIDLFGRVTRSIRRAEAELGGAQATLADLQTVVIAETADAYVAMRGLQAQLAVARDNAANQAETVRLVTVRQAAGRGTDLDVERARAQAAVTRALVPVLEAEARAAAYRLGTLVGVRPEEAAVILAASAPLPLIAGDLPIGDPGALLRRRPDVRAAERDLAAATQGIGLEISSAFPLVSLTGAISSQTIGTDGVFTEDALAFSYGPQVAWSLTNLLRARQRIEAARARAGGRFDAYEQTVLLALAETETALASQRAQRQRLDELTEAERASAAAARLARLRFDAGASDFLAVLDAERRRLEAADALAATRTQAARSQVAVFRALRAGVPTLYADGAAASE